MSLDEQLAVLPPQMQPQGPPRGRYSYSLKATAPGSMAVVEILLRERTCFARRRRDGSTPPGPRSFAWRACGGPAEAFAAALASTGCEA